jgi:hypothetical protein
MLRGSGTRGLAGMPAARDRVRRPFLGFRRSETREICARLGLVPAVDPMNDDVRHRRVWLRREVLPRLEAGAGRDLVPLLARTASVVADDDALLDELAGVHVEVAEIVALPPPLARRAVRRAFGAPPISSAETDAVLDVAHGRRRAVELAGRGRVERVAGRLALVPADEAVPAATVVPLPGTARLEAGLLIEGWVETAPPTAWPDGRSTCVVDADAVGSHAVARPALRGERFRPLGARGSKTVFGALAELAVPASARGRRLVLAAGDAAVVPAGTPLWVLGYRIDDRVRVTSRTRRFLWIAATGSTG